ncbi:hypothetical protein, partial [Plantactinospora sp. CA-290183]|uniref:hypothetical protein n=1 Tax=Plantactinospora sp. CA-290183 TaxID=3240006 RepID=UPI003D915DC6
MVVCDRDPEGDGTFGGECTYTFVSRTGNVENPPAEYPRMSADARLLVYRSGIPISLGGPKLVLVTLGRGPAGAIPFPGPTDFTDVVPPWTEVGTVRYRPTAIGSFAVSADGSHLGLTVTYRALDGDDELERVYDYAVATGTFLRMDVDGTGTALPDRYREDIALSGDGRRLAFAEFTDGGLLGGTEPVVRLYDRDPDADGVWYPADGEPLGAEFGSRDTADEVVAGRGPAFSADGRYFAFVTDAGDVHNGVDDSSGLYSCLYSGWGDGLPLLDAPVNDVPV